MCMPNSLSSHDPSASSRCILVTKSIPAGTLEQLQTG